MKKTILGLAVFAVIALCVVCVLSLPATDSVTHPALKNGLTFGSSKASQNANVSFELQTSYPTVPKQVTIYQAESPVVSKDSIETLGKQVGVSGSLKESRNEYVLTDNDHILEIHEKSGRIAYIDNVRWNQITGKDVPANLPPDSEATKIATDYLEKSGLMSEDAVLSKVIHQQILALDSAGKTTSIPYEAIKVSYSRSIDGLPVVGAGSKLSVEIGGGGDVIQMYKLWRTYVPQEKSVIITPEQAFDELKKQGVTGISTKDAVTAKVTKVYLAYYEDSAMEEQDQFLPVYVFEGNVAGMEVSGEFTEYVPAIPGLAPAIPSTK